jgi:hypothetical protein
MQTQLQERCGREQSRRETTDAVEGMLSGKFFKPLAGEYPTSSRSSHVVRSSGLVPRRASVIQRHALKYLARAREYLIASLKTGNKVSVRAPSKPTNSLDDHMSRPLFLDKALAIVYRLQWVISRLVPANASFPLAFCTLNPFEHHSPEWPGASPTRPTSCLYNYL